eukprot:5201143-Amphidinium_carterae.1
MVMCIRARRKQAAITVNKGHECVGLTILFGPSLTSTRSMLMTYGKLQQSAGLSDTSFFALSTTTDDVEAHCFMPC